MRLWTIQSMAAWELLQREQVLVAAPRYIDEDFIEPYTWLTKQMEYRLRSKSDSWPLWAWYQWNGINRPKPDLRSIGHLPKGERGVRIEFEQSDDGVLLSDFVLWHYVLNYWYLPETEADSDAFMAELSEHNLDDFLKRLLPAPYRQRIEDSWNRIFDLNWFDEYLTQPYSQKSIQATFWKLRFHQIRDVKAFTSRG